MSLREFLENVVRPNVAELCEDYASIRKAFNAFAALDALAAHLYRHLSAEDHPSIARVADDVQYRELLADESPDFRLVRDVAKANKHCWLTRGTPLVSGANQTSRKSLGWGQMRWGEGRYGSPDQAVVTTDGGENRVAESLAKNCLNFLEGKLRSYGI